MATSTTTALASTTLVNIPGYGAEKTCPTCGQAPDHPHHPAELTRQRVKDLEGQVSFLNAQAAQMTEKLAEYADEVQRLRAQQSSHSQPAPDRASLTRNTSFVSATSTTSAPSHAHSNSNSNSLSQSPPQQQQPQGRLSSLASLLPYRRPSTASQPRPSSQQTSQSSPPAPLQPQSTSASASASASHTQTPPRTPTPRPSTSVSTEETAELQNALTREQSLRKAAETQLTQASTELEELTAQLFSQANEMVAQERKARARLEERVAVLERRDVEKRNRLERLEKAMERVERIRALVR
ncbi:uncharacterized protein BDV17DRAFT_255784 [Aspergillus undulatus]|uniref:uncharacterized protein n=1 Tax=Aspergillus undulatus TaxID=1810928 RepID=UPI003CCD9A81